jgi:hypothetical protein
MYIPRNWEFGSALAKLRNFGAGGGRRRTPSLGTPLTTVERNSLVTRCRCVRQIKAAFLEKRKVVWDAAVWIGHADREWQHTLWHSREVPIGFDMPACPSVRPSVWPQHSARLTLDEFPLRDAGVFYQNLYRKSEFSSNLARYMKTEVLLLMSTSSSRHTNALRVKCEAVRITEEVQTLRERTIVLLLPVAGSKIATYVKECNPGRRNSPHFFFFLGFWPPPPPPPPWSMVLPCRWVLWGPCLYHWLFVTGDVTRVYQAVHEPNYRSDIQVCLSDSAPFAIS